METETVETEASIKLSVTQAFQLGAQKKKDDLVVLRKLTPLFITLAVKSIIVSLWFFNSNKA